MLISCPSCGKSHDSAKHHGAFEIDCDCGYSILIPDEEALSSQNDDNNPGFHSPPIAMDEEDNSIAINVEGGGGLESAVPDSNPFAPFDGATDMTPEAELPDGMIYDPDEADALADSKEAWSQDSKSEGETFLDPFESEKPQDPDEFEEPELEIPTVSTAAALIERNQSASIGHLVGSYFDLNLGSLDENILLKLASRCEELLKTNPWLKQLVITRKSKCDAEHFVSQKKLEALPEVLALELFLYCYELGGTCSFTPAEELELHSP
jgi:hypothetical protein